MNPDMPNQKQKVDLMIVAGHFVVDRFILRSCIKMFTDRETRMTRIID